MADCKSESTISCEIRCMDPATVQAASAELDPEGTARVDYTCKLSGEQESILLIGDALAASILKSLPAAESTIDVKLLAALYSAELCECDLATVSAAPEHEVVTRLHGFTEAGVLAHRRLQGMNYFRLVSDAVRSVIRDAVEPSG